MSTNSRSNSRANFSSEIHDIGTARNSTTPNMMFYNEKSIADYFPPHLLKKVSKTDSVDYVDGKTKCLAVDQLGLMRMFALQMVSEVVSTFLLVFMTCGAAAISASDPTRISQLGQSVAGGLIVTVMIYSVGHISGAHMNPAVTLSFAVFRHFPWIQVRPQHTQLNGTVTLHIYMHYLPSA